MSISGVNSKGNSSHPGMLLMFYAVIAVVLIEGLGGQ